MVNGCVWMLSDVLLQNCLNFIVKEWNMKRNLLTGCFAFKESDCLFDE